MNKNQIASLLSQLVGPDPTDVQTQAADGLAAYIEGLELRLITLETNVADIERQKPAVPGQRCGGS